MEKLTGNQVGGDVMIFGVDVSSSLYIDNILNNILIFGQGLTQGLECTVAPEIFNLINFAKANKKFCLILHYNKINSISQHIHCH